MSGTRTISVPAGTLKHFARATKDSGTTIGRGEDIDTIEENAIVSKRVAERVHFSEDEVKEVAHGVAV